MINPVRETGLVKFRVPSDPISLMFGTRIATDYVQPHIGGDLALLWGIAKALQSLAAIDENFIAENCLNYESWQQKCEEISWDEITEKSGNYEFKFSIYKYNISLVL